MPYVAPENRQHLDRGIEPLDAGEVNYLITKLLLKYIEDNDPQISYSKINEVVGILECVKLEFYRRLAANYEEEKRRENGDVGYNHIRIAEGICNV